MNPIRAIDPLIFPVIFSNGVFTVVGRLNEHQSATDASFQKEKIDWKSWYSKYEYVPRKYNNN